MFQRLKLEKKKKEMAERWRQRELEVAGWPDSNLSQETEGDKRNGSAPYTASFYTVHNTLLKN